ncbi:immunoglobulin-like domain-containing protein [Lentibacillus sp. N15]|uniref:immunoglobulin-like domain-containing protein n=1 Tax=Lentibacillus songyuanensis TaxID=3136161 RepID=UPI0031BB7051
MKERIKRSFQFYLLFMLFIFTFLPFQTMAAPDNKPVLQYVALGDSLAAGYLNGVPAEEKLKGYPDFIQEGIQEQFGYHVELTNAGVGGYRTDNVYDDLKNNKDNIMESIKEADIITVGAGANDVLQAVKDDLANLDPNKPEEIQILVNKAMTAIGQVEEYTQKILNEIEMTNPDAQVYVLGYYNALPYLDDLQEQVILLINMLNNTIEGVTANKGAVFIPTFEAFDGKRETYLPDPNDIHPTEEGYQVIADLFLKKISLKDHVQPEITLIGNNPMEMMFGDEYIEPGAEAMDNVDGDLTDAIEITGDVNVNEAGKYLVTYTVSDQAGNEAMATRTVIVQADTDSPVITLLGDNPMNLTVGEEYVEPGATVEDDVEGNLTDDVRISGEVDMSTAGMYVVTYKVSDAAGNEATKRRTVNVVEPEADNNDNNEGDGGKGESSGNNDNDDNELGLTENCNCNDDGNGTDKNSNDSDNKTTTSKVKGAQLPSTASNLLLFIAVGLFLIIGGGVLVLIRRKVFI